MSVQKRLWSHLALNMHKDKAKVSVCPECKNERVHFQIRKAIRRVIYILSQDGHILRQHKKDIAASFGKPLREHAAGQFRAR